MVRLLTMKTAWLMDTVGNRHARVEIAAIKVAAPQVALKIIDRAIQVHGGGGVSDDFPLANMWAHQRTLRLADGPDEVHKRTIAQRELRRWETPSGDGAVDVRAPRRWRAEPWAGPDRAHGDRHRRLAGHRPGHAPRRCSTPAPTSS